MVNDQFFMLFKSINSYIHEIHSILNFSESFPTDIRTASVGIVHCLEVTIGWIRCKINNAKINYVIQFMILSDLLK